MTIPLQHPRVECGHGDGIGRAGATSWTESAACRAIRLRFQVRDTLQYQHIHHDELI
jgi:hypothetical protein